MNKLVVPGTQDEHSTAGFDMNAAFKAYIEHVTVDDMTDSVSSRSNSAEKEDDTDDDKEVSLQTRPNGLYKKEHRLMRKRLFPCSVCGTEADMSH
jgi:hypothetical protein